MGGLKEYLIESDESLADELGITPDELEELDYEIHEQCSDDGLIYSYRVEFSEDCPLHILERIDGIEDGRFVSLPPESFAKYDDPRFDAVLQNKSPYNTFYADLLNTKKLIELPVDGQIQAILYGQVFVHIICLMETYLSDTMINKTLSNESYLKRFIISHPVFRERKFELREIFEQTQKLNETVKGILLDTIYHKLPEVREMYIATFGIRFPSIQTMQRHIRNRHDLVHRNGKTKDGSILEITQSILYELVKDTNDFVVSINGSILEIEFELPF